MIIIIFKKIATERKRREEQLEGELKGLRPVPGMEATVALQQRL